MDPAPDPKDPLVFSYLELRQSVGAIGMLLPFVVSIGTILLSGPQMLSSISSYYYSIMGDVFVGSLCAIGVFLWSYKGYDRRDAIAGNIAAFFAIGVALFPTEPDVVTSTTQTVIGHLHLLFAAGFFLTLAYFSLALFRKTSADKAPTRMKLIRNAVYTVAGYTILLSIAAIALMRFVPADSAIQTFTPVFWFESIAIIAFGFSWIVKGEAILKD